MMRLVTIGHRSGKHLVSRTKEVEGITGNDEEQSSNIEPVYANYCLKGSQVD